MDTDSGARTRLRTLLALAAAAVAALALAACGSTSTNAGGSSGNVQSILQQTFSSGRHVHSGVLALNLAIDPSGSTTLTTPVLLSLGGPFQSHGSGHLPSSQFTVRVSALGKAGALSIISTGTAGYVSLGGDSYRLPQADFQRLESSFSSSGSSGSGGLAGLGINPQHWLAHPAIVGTDTVGGAPTTHIRAGLDAAGFLSDLNGFLGRAAKQASGSGVPSGISPATQQKIAAAVRDTTVDIWTGRSDRILRKLSIALTLPVTGQASTVLGGLRSAAMQLTLQYSGLNQPQTIAAPAHVLPYSQFTAKLRSAMSALTGGAAGGQSPAPTGAVDKYSRCIQAAGQDVSKMQKCASLLGGG